MKEAVKAMSLPIEPHATYLQTLMTLTNQTLSKSKFLAEMIVSGSFAFRSVINFYDKS